MLNTKFRGYRPFGSGEDDFTIYGHGGHLGHVTTIILTEFHFHVPKSLHTKLVKTARWFLRKGGFNFHT